MNEDQKSNYPLNSQLGVFWLLNFKVSASLHQYKSKHLYPLNTFFFINVDPRKIRTHFLQFYIYVQK